MTLDELIAHLQRLRETHGGALPVYVQTSHECAPIGRDDVSHEGAYTHPTLSYLNLPERIRVSGW